LRADLPGPDSTEPSGAPFLINYGADPLIGPKPLIDSGAACAVLLAEDRFGDA
jgi:hypothetical protein